MNTADRPSTSRRDHTHRARRPEAASSASLTGPFITRPHKSRSPDGRTRPGSRSPSRPRRSKARKRPVTESVVSSRASSPDRMIVDRFFDRKPKAPKPKPAPRPSESVDQPILGQDIRALRPARPQESRLKAVSKSALVETDVSEEVERRVYSGPIAQAELDRLKEELHEAKKQMREARKVVTKQQQTISNLEEKVSVLAKAKKDHSHQVEKLKAKHKQSEELITSIENTCQCQICMEPLLKPYANSCGHVFCQNCLQGWFRSAPPSADEMHIDADDEDAMLFRRKTCPTCRTTVRVRPSPLFLVKSISSALAKAKQPAGAAKQASPPPDESDPWEGIFRAAESSDEFDEEEDEEESGLFDEEDEDGEVDEEDEDGEGGWWSEFGYATGSDEERFEGTYVRARWAPPERWLDPEEYDLAHLSEGEIAVLRRGGTLAMRALFSLRYTHEEGLEARVDGRRIRLGWNISLHDEDETGEGFVEWVVNDIEERPERWNVNAAGDAWRLVKEYEDEAFDTTDTEAFMDEEVDG